MSNTAHFEQPPVKRGPIYCAPWCGASCTWADFQEATKSAKALAKSLGSGWTPVVSENMGWHYKVTNGILEVTTLVIKGKTTYTAWCQSNPQVIGEHASSAKLAVASLGKKMAAQFEEQIAAFHALEAAYLTITGKQLSSGLKGRLGA